MHPDKNKEQKKQVLIDYIHDDLLTFYNNTRIIILQSDFPYSLAYRFLINFLPILRVCSLFIIPLRDFKPLSEITENMNIRDI
jgi:hypothetical protein